MSREYTYLYVADCPPAERDALAEAARECGFDELDELLLREAYLTELDAEAPIWVTDELERAAPGAVFQVWNHHGQSVVRTPELGRYTHPCDADGDPVFSAQEVRALATLTGEHLAIALGDPWYGALEGTRANA